MKIISINNLSLERRLISHFINIFILLIPVIVFSNDCSYECWNQVYLQGGELVCNETVALEDNFDGNTLDNTKWQTFYFEEGYIHDRTHTAVEETFYFDENVSVENGACIFTGRYEPNTTYTNSQGETFTRHFTTGMIMSKEGFKFGRYEASFKIPGKGWWPAFWLWHHDEIDIFENLFDDTKFLTNIYSGDQDECDNYSKENSADLLDGNWHKFAVEWTPFKISFYHDNVLLEPEIYRYYNKSGISLDIDCLNNTIPQGKYYVNPNFVELRERVFRPILDLSILPRHGLDSSCTYDITCSSTDCGVDWGHPIDKDCEVVGELPARMYIDYVKVTEFDYSICNSVLTYGNNCALTGVKRTPKDCKPVCVNVPSNVYVENYFTNDWLSEVDILNVTSGNKIQILSFDNFEIIYKFLTAGSDWIEIAYLDACNNQAKFRFTLRTEEILSAGIQDMLVVDNKPCNYTLTLTSSFEENCNINFNAMAVNIWGNTLNATVSRNKNELLIDYNQLNFAEYLTLEINYESECQGNIVQQRTFDIISCADCCPKNTFFDGVSCWFYNFPQSYSPFVLNNGFYTNPNCGIDNSNNCCPEGSTYDGLNCFFGYFPSEFNGFVYGNSFFTNADCSYCPSDRALSGTSSSSTKVDVHNSIQSTSIIQGTPIVYYNAGNRIELQSGFSISADANFSATIKPCDP